MQVTPPPSCAPCILFCPQGGCRAGGSHLQLPQLLRMGPAEEGLPASGKAPGPAEIGGPNSSVGRRGSSRNILAGVR